MSSQGCLRSTKNCSINQTCKIKRQSHRRLLRPPEIGLHEIAKFTTFVTLQKSSSLCNPGIWKSPFIWLSNLQASQNFHELARLSKLLVVETLKVRLVLLQWESAYQQRSTRNCAVKALSFATQIPSRRSSKARNGRQAKCVDCTLRCANNQKGTRSRRSHVRRRPKTHFVAVDPDGGRLLTPGQPGAVIIVHPLVEESQRRVTSDRQG